MNVQRVRSLVLVAVASGLLAGGCRNLGPLRPSAAAAATAPTAARG